MYKTESMKMRGTALAAVIVLTGYVHVWADSKPGAKRVDGDPNLVANAGLTRYVAEDPITLDGRGSYEPESWGQLAHQWRQISGPSVIIEDANTATPTISGFVQTSEVQTCVFELVVSSGGRFGEPDTVEVVIVPDFGESTLLLGNEWFDPDKPTFIIFNGGSTCSIGGGGVIDDPGWLDQVNSIGFSSYQPDAGSSPRTFYQYGDMIIVFLSGAVKDYKQSICTAGFSAGGTPALDVGIRLNRTYQDARFALNCAILIDGGYCLEARGNPPDYINQYLSSSVDGEPCRIQSYNGANKLRHLYPNVLNVDTDLSHSGMAYWYFNSFAYPDMNVYNGGVVAHDSGIRANDGAVNGDPNWLVNGGQLGGALELDGTDDYVSTDFVFNPADYGPFSVFAWVKGGAPEEVVISQTNSGQDGRNWLAADSAGNLMTDLRRLGRGAQPLISEVTIIDGYWRHIGLVWDGSYRRLYSDGVEVAADSYAVAGVVGAEGGLHIGADAELNPARFWTGLIDDVRLYDDAVTP